MLKLARVFLVLMLSSGTMTVARGAPAQVQAAISQILLGGQRLPLPLERVRQTLVTHYVTNHATPYWTTAVHSLPFIQRVQNAAYDGLEPSAYPTTALINLATKANTGDDFAAAQEELYYTAFFIAYATDLKVGRVAPANVDPNLFRSRKSIDALRLLTDLWRQPSPSKFLSTYEPRNRHYQTLKRMLKVYTDVINSGMSWPRVADGAPIKVGQSDPRVAQIREILSITGDFSGPATTSSVYDQKLYAAMQMFQTRHGLEAKGLVGKQSIMALNTSPQERQKQIILNMERWRWMPDNLGADHFLVNIAGFELERVEANRVVDRMNVVAGAVATQTPEFSADMQYVELNPTWTVPYNIATKEMLPKLRVNPFAYAQEFDVFTNGRLSNWSGINWNAYGPGRFPFTFRQRPGPSNALGKVKFMLPNSHNIYLHDTPAKDKFASTTRAFSHGCIRLSQPEQLAYSLLGSKLGMTPPEIQAIWATNKTTQINLPTKIPVHLVYATAFATDNGIEFRPDVYGRDQKLYAALFGRPQG
jgi:L,D-transpeptidase YcbB